MRQLYSRYFNYENGEVLKKVEALNYVREVKYSGVKYSGVKNSGVQHLGVKYLGVKYLGVKHLGERPV